MGKNDRRLKRLIELVDDLEQFLRLRGQDFWAGKLTDIRRELANEETHLHARLELDSIFGGIGSLNDVGFQDNADQTEFGRLADSVFKENKLLRSGFRERFRWLLRDVCRDEDELPPRILNGFAR